MKLFFVTCIFAVMMVACSRPEAVLPVEDEMFVQIKNQLEGKYELIQFVAAIDTLDSKQLYCAFDYRYKAITENLDIAFSSMVITSTACNTLFADSKGWHLTKMSATSNHNTLTLGSKTYHYTISGSLLKLNYTTDLDQDGMVDDQIYLLYRKWEA